MRHLRAWELEIESPARVHLTHQEGAAVCTLELPVSAESEGIREAVLQEINALSDWIDQRGGIVGHIKAALKTSFGTVFFFNAGDGTSVQMSAAAGDTLQLTVIAFLVEDQTLKERLEQTLKRLAGK